MIEVTRQLQILEVEVLAMRSFVAVRRNEGEETVTVAVVSVGKSAPQPLWADGDR